MRWPIRRTHRAGLYTSPRSSLISVHLAAAPVCRLAILRPPMAVAPIRPSPGPRRSYSQWQVAPNIPSMTRLRAASDPGAYSLDRRGLHPPPSLLWPPSAHRLNGRTCVGEFEGQLTLISLGIPTFRSGVLFGVGRIPDKLAPRGLSCPAHWREPIAWVKEGFPWCRGGSP